VPAIDTGFILDINLLGCA